MRFQVLIFLTIISLAQCDSSCTQRPPDSSTVSVMITQEQTRGPFISLKLNNLTNPASEANMVNAVSEQCPNNCIFRMKTYIANHGGSTLHVRDPYPALIPLGYNAMTSNQNLFCAREMGNCGATVPLYRHYRLDSTGIHHAYSFNTSSISSYVRETFPLCYVWSTVAAREPRASIPQSCANKNEIESKHLISLNEYKNDQIAFFTDRYVTTRSTSDPKLTKYTLEKAYGKVLPETHQSTCDCLIKLKQQAETSIPLNRLNHRLSPLSQQNSFYENYADEGETFFCVKTQGACGASVPLYRYFNFIQMSYVYSTASSPIMFAIPSPTDPLCYIWPVSYSVNVTSTSSTQSSTSSTTPRTSTVISSTTTSSNNVTTSKPSPLLLADSKLNSTSTASPTTSLPKNVTTLPPSNISLAHSPQNSTTTTSSTISSSNTTSVTNTTTSTTVKSATNTSLPTSTTSTIASSSSNTTITLTTSSTPSSAAPTTSSVTTSTTPNANRSSYPTEVAPTTRGGSPTARQVIGSRMERSDPQLTVETDHHEYGPSYAVVVVRTANETSTN